MLLYSFLDNEIHVRTVDADCDDNSHDDGHECEARLAEIESVEKRINQREHFEKGVIDSVNQTGIYIGKSDGGIQNSDLYGDVQGIDHDLMDC